MKREIRKYLLDSPDCYLTMQDKSTVLTVGVQGINIVLWAIAPIYEPPVHRRFISWNTGHTLPDWLDKHNYIGTVQIEDIVWHIFEVSTRVT